MIAAVVALQAFVGYAYQVRVLYQLSRFTNSMALHTTLIFGVLCLGILAWRSNRGLMRILTSDLIGGKVAR